MATESAAVRQGENPRLPSAAGEIAAGKELPPRPRGVWTFCLAYVKSMRLYYAFITGVAGWIGLAFADFVHPECRDRPREVLILVFLFLCWGINQIFNDYLGRAEDRVNAPHRPMVTGELNAAWALSISAALIAVTAAVSWWLSPWAVIPLAGGVALNIIYEYAKGVPVLGNVVFGVMISMCTAYGYLAMGPSLDVVFTAPRLSVLALVALMNGLMTYYTYFKDYDGDRAAGKVTAVVLQGIEASRRVALVSAVLPSVAFWILKGVGYIESPINLVFMILFLATLALQIWTGWLYFRHPTGPQAYYSLVTNFRACVCGQVMFIALFNQLLAACLYVAAYVLVGLLFALHKDHKS